jgi:Tfp pilus assembly protein PilV
MEMGTVLFALVLLSAGILLILLFRKGLKERALAQERRASSERTQPRAATRAMMPAIAVTREQPATWQSLSASSIREAFEKFAPRDPWRTMNTSSVSDAFEEFMRKP